MNRASNNMNHMVITPQVYNLLMVSVAMLFIVYGYRACDRFYRTLKLRAAVLSNKLIEIKGVGENLIFLSKKQRLRMLWALFTTDKRNLLVKWTVVLFHSKSIL